MDENFLSVRKERMNSIKSNTKAKVYQNVTYIFTHRFDFKVSDTILFANYKLSYF